MTRMNRLALLTGTTFVLAASSFAQYQNFQQFLGPEVGLYLPAQSALRDAVGSQWVSLGLGSVSLKDAQKTKFSPNFNAITGDKNGNKIFLFSYSFGMTQPLTSDLSKAGVVPFYALRGGLSYIDYGVTTAPGVRTSGKKLGWNGNAEVGIIFSQRLALSARYDLFPRYDGLQFDGLSLSLKYGLFNF